MAYFYCVSNNMPVGKRLHLSYERMVLLADSAPAFKNEPSVAVRTISRIQDVSYSFDYGAMQLKEIGSSEFIKDRTPALNADPMKSRIPIVVQPTVTLEFSYLFFDAKNEENLGMNVRGGYLFEYDNSSYSKLYNKPDWSNQGSTAEAKKGDINLYLLAEQTSARSDLFGRGDKSGGEFKNDLDLVGLGNCYLSNYSISARVGSFVSCNVAYECSNICLDTINFDAAGLINTVKAPAVDNTGTRSQSDVIITRQQLEDAALETDTSDSSLALRPGDMEITWTNNKNNSSGGFSMVDIDPESMSIQSLDISLEIGRQEINAFGSNYIKDRKIQFPMSGSMSSDIILRNFSEKDDLQIANIFKDDVSMDIEIKLYSRTGLDDRKKYATIKIPDAKLSSESHSMSVGGFAQISAEFLFEVGLKTGMQIIKHT